MYKPLKLWAVSGHRSFTSPGSCSWFHSEKEIFRLGKVFRSTGIQNITRKRPKANFLVTVIQEYNLNAQVLVISLFIIIRRDQEKLLLNMLGKCMQLWRYVVFSQYFWKKKKNWGILSSVEVIMRLPVFKYREHEHYNSHKSRSFVPDKYSPSLSLKWDDGLMANSASSCFSKLGAWHGKYKLQSRWYSGCLWLVQWMYL